MSNLIINPFAFGAPAGNGPDGTNYYVEVTIPTTSVTASLSDFPVYVDLSDLPAAFWSHVQAHGGDIRVTQSDGSTRCAAELVSINTGTATGELHFLAAAISDATDTTFRVYYGHGSLTQPSVTATYGRNAVWASFARVYHLDTTPTSALIDSTGNADATSHGSMTSGDSVAGQLGRAIDLDGNNDYLSAAALTVATDVTLIISAKARTLTAQQYLICDRSDFLATGAKFNGALRLNASNVVEAQFYDGSSVAALSGGSLSASAWKRIAARHSGGGAALFIDGSSVDTAASVGSLLNPGTALLIGAVTADIAPTVRGLFNGLVDEARVLLSAPTDAWISAEAASLSAPSSFLSVGSEQDA